MRFYKNKQAEILNRVSFFLQTKREKLVKNVPAFRKAIDEFTVMEKNLNTIQHGNKNVVKVNTLNKGIAKREFVKVTAKLIAVLNAADYKAKGKPLAEM